MPWHATRYPAVVLGVAPVRWGNCRMAVGARCEAISGPVRCVMLYHGAGYLWGADCLQQCPGRQWIIFTMDEK